MTPAHVGVARNTNTAVGNSPTVPLPLAVARDDLAKALRGGEDWYRALLRAISWCDKNELYLAGYLIDREALDLISLAGWLIKGMKGIPEEEVEALLLGGVPPRSLLPYEFRELIGVDRYHEYLNYCYGVTVETGLILAVRQEVRKEKLFYSLKEGGELDTEVSRRLYGVGEDELWQNFLLDKGYGHSEKIVLSRVKEFIYYAFKLRIKVSEKSKVASDTKKALEFLEKNGFRPSLLSY